MLLWKKSNLMVLNDCNGKKMAGTELKGAFRGETRKNLRSGR